MTCIYCGGASHDESQCPWRRDAGNFNISINGESRRPMFRTNVVFTKAGHRAQVWADLHLSDRYNVLIWEGEPTEDREAAERDANDAVEAAVRRLFYSGNAGVEAKRPAPTVARPLVRDSPQA